MFAGQLHLSARVGACGCFSDFDCSICNNDPRASEAYGALEEQAGELWNSPPSVFAVSNLGSDASGISAQWSQQSQRGGLGALAVI